MAITVTNVNETPTVTSGGTANFAENGTGTAYTATATDPDAGTTLTYALGGTDAALFNINSSTGAVTFKAAPNYEAPADAGGNNVYDITVTASDGAITTAATAVAITVTNVNETPTAVGTVSAQTAVKGQAFSLDVHTYFADQDTGSNGTLTYSATGLPTGITLNASTGVISGTATADRAPAQVNVTATDGGGLHVSQAFNLQVASEPTLQSSALDNVTNFDVSSNIVLNFSESVTAVADKYVHIVNDANDASKAGFRTETTAHTLDILVTDTSQVSISNGKVTLNPTFDLDLANNYHITIDDGAFLGVSSGLPSSAYDGTTSLNFSTVTPGTTALASAVASQKMDAGGALAASYQWLDIEGIGSPSGTATTLNLSGGNYALVAKDYDAGGADSGAGYDGIQVGDLYVAATDFATGDLIYLDDQASSAANDLAYTLVINDNTAPTQIQFAGSSLGGFIDVTVAGSVTDYDSISALNTAVGSTAVITA